MTTFSVLMYMLCASKSIQQSLTYRTSTTSTTLQVSQATSCRSTLTVGRVVGVGDTPNGTVMWPTKIGYTSEVTI